MNSKPITILAITIIVIGAIIFFFIRPVVSSVWTSWKNLEKSRQEIQDVERKKQIIEEIKNNPQLKDIANIALKYIPQESESGQLVIELTAIASTNNLIVEQTSMDQKASQQTTTPSPGASASPETAAIKEIQFTMGLSGAYNDFLNFLAAVDSSSRLIALRTLTLNRQETTNEQGQANFKAQISGSAYYKADVSIAKTIDNLKVPDETIRKFLNLKSYGLPINLTTEAGFGRSNPFEGY